MPLLSLRGIDGGCAGLRRPTAPRRAILGASPIGERGKRERTSEKGFSARRAAMPPTCVTSLPGVGLRACAAMAHVLGDSTGHSRSECADTAEDPGHFCTYNSPGGGRGTFLGKLHSLTGRVCDKLEMIITRP